MTKEIVQLHATKGTGYKVVRALTADLTCGDASGGTINLGGIENPEDRAAKIIQVVLTYAAASANCALDVGIGDAITDKDKTDFMADVDNTSAGSTVAYTGATETGEHKELAANGETGDCIVVTQGAQDKSTKVSVSVLLGYEY